MKNITFIICLFFLLITANSFSQVPIIYGQSINSTIINNEIHTYTFPGEIGDAIIIKVISTDNTFFDSDLELRDPLGGVIASVIVINGEARIGAEILNSNGEFLILFKDDNGSDEGEYCISLQKVNNPIDNISLDCGGSESASVNCGTEMPAFTFGVTANTIVFLAANANATFFDPRIEVYSSTGDLIAFDETINGQVELEITFNVEDCITVIVMDDDGSNTGNITLSSSLIFGNCTNECSLDSEICNNGIDDDGDNLIDSDDPDCGSISPVTASASQNGNYCQNETIQLMVDGSDTYNWSGPNNFTSTDQNPQISNANSLMSGTYNVTVCNANGCDQSSINITVNQAPQITINANPNPATEGQTINLSATGGTTYSWSGPNNFNSQIATPSISNVSLSDAGEYCVTVTDNNSCTATDCVSLVVNGMTGEVTLIAGEIEGIAGQTVQIPIFLEGCDILASLQGTIELQDLGIANFIGATSGQMEVTFNETNGAFTFFDQGGGVDISPNEALFFIDVELIGNPGDMTDVIFTNSITNIEISCIENGNQILIDNLLFTDGKVTILSNFDITGMIWTCEDQEIFQSFVSITGTAPDGTTIDQTFDTEMTNEYIFEDLSAGSEITLSVSKDINYPNGLSTFWLFQIQQMIIGNPAPFITDPCQVIAADSDCNDQVTTADLFRIQQVIVGLSDDFTDCPSWRFFPVDYEFPIPFDLNNVFPFPESVTVNPLASDEMIDFRGVKIGDIGLQADPSQLVGVDDRNANPLLLQFPNNAYQKGEIIEILVRPTNLQELLSFQFELQFDTQNLDFIAAESLFPNLLIGDKKTEEGALRFGWFSSKSVGEIFNNQQPIFKLIFQAKKDLSKLDSQFLIENKTLQSEAVSNDLNFGEVLLDFEEFISKKGIQLYQNVPNPFSNTTQISFDLPEQTIATIQVVNHLGQIVFETTNEFEKGQHQIDFNKKQLPYGIYFYSLNTDSQTFTKNMIISQ